MPPIKSFRLIDCQSYDDSTFDFHPGFNAIIGSSNSGKSVTVRFLRLNLNGEWKKSWVRTGAKDAQTYIHYEDGHIIHRVKGSTNRVSKTDPNGKTEDFSGFGDDTPEVVRRIFGVSSFKLDSDKALEPNVSRQHDALFLLNEPGSYCAKVLGRLSGLHIIDLAIRNLNADSRNCAIGITNEEAKIKELKSKLERYSTLEANRSRLRDLDAEIAEQKRVREDLKSFERLGDLVARFNSDLASTKLKIERLSSLDAIDYKKEFFEKLKELGLCPTCGSEMTNEMVCHMAETA